MRIAPPFGYQEVVPFLKTQKVRFLKAGDVPEFVQRSNAIPISYTEFQPVATWTTWCERSASFASKSLSSTTLRGRRSSSPTAISPKWASMERLLERKAARRQA